MGAAVSVRSARLDDLDALLALYEQLSPGNGPAPRDVAASELGELLASPYISLFVAERDGVVIGTVTLVVVPGLTHGAKRWSQLENMVVDEAERGTGVGRLLIEACLARAREAGCYKVQLQSAKHRTDAHRFYESRGFTASSMGYRLYFDE